MKAKYGIYIGLLKRFAAPVIIGGLVVWLMHHGLDNWASVVCDISSNLGIFVSECN